MLEILIEDFPQIRFRYLLVYWMQPIFGQVSLGTGRTDLVQIVSRYFYYHYYKVRSCQCTILNYIMDYFSFPQDHTNFNLPSEDIRVPTLGAA